MTAASYVPGTWLGIVRSRTAVLLGPESPAELAGALWELLAGRPEPHEVLAAVTSSSGGSLTRIPSFGILDFNGSLRVFLRGDINLTVEQPGGAVDLDGREVTTWNERKFVVPGKCQVKIADGGTGSTGKADGQPELPLAEGVVLLQSLTLGAPSGRAAVNGQAAAGNTAMPASAIVEVPAPDILPEPAVLPERAVLPEPGDLPETTLLPEHGASAETVMGVIEEDPDDDRPIDGDVNLSSLDGLDPDATIGPDAIISADGEVVGEAVGLESTSPEPVEATGADPAGAGPKETDAAPAAETTTSYDHLWDRTVMRNIEDAAVREDPDADSGHVSAQQPAALPAAEPLPALGAAEEVAPHAPSTRAGTGTVDRDQAGSGTSPNDGPAVPPRPASTGVLIDSVPWRTGGTTPGAQPAAAAPAPGAAQALGTPPAGQNVPSSAPTAETNQEPAARQEAAPAQEPGAGFDPDHDGQTVMKSSLPGTASGPATNAPAAQQDAAGGPLVLARVCARGHANPPTRAQCSACGAALLPDAVQVSRPRLGRMRLSTGELLDLDQSMVVGRQPSVSRVQGGVMPRLVQVASPGGDISRSHVEVRLEGWHVMLCDLKATNGTVLVREGQPPRRLAQNEMAILLDGDIAELGENISLRFEEIP